MGAGIGTGQGAKLMPTQIGPLDAALAYMWCSLCAQQGNPRSPLTRDGSGAIRCQFGHQPSGSQLESSDMVKFGEVFHETLQMTDIKWPIWINPQVKSRLEQRFPQNLMATIANLLTALSDNTVIILSGPEVKRLKEKGVKNGLDMLAVIESGETAAKERDDAVSQLSKVLSMIKQASG